MRRMVHNISMIEDEVSVCKRETVKEIQEEEKGTETIGITNIYLKKRQIDLIPRTSC